MPEARRRSSVRTRELTRRQIAVELRPERLRAHRIANPQGEPRAIGLLAEPEVVPDQAAAEEKPHLGPRAHPRPEAPKPAPVARGKLGGIAQPKVRVRPGVERHPPEAADLVGPARVVEPGATRAGRVDDTVVSAAPDHAQQRCTRPGTLDQHHIVPAPQVQAQLPRVGPVEAPVEQRARALALRRVDRHVQRPIGRVGRFHPLGLVARIHLHLGGEHAIEPPGGEWELVTPALERAGQCRLIEGPQLGGKALHRVVDHRVREPLLERGRDRVPHRPLEAAEQPAIDHSRVPGEPHDAGIRGGEFDQLRSGEPGQGQQQAVEPGKGLVAVARDRGPREGIRVAQPGPAPLVLVAVPVAQEYVDQPRGQERAGIDPLVLVLLEPLEQLLGADDLARAGEAWALVRRTLLDGAEHPAELAPELAQRRRIGKQHQARLRMEDTGGVEERAHHQRRGGVAGADLILHDLVRDRPAELRRHHQGRILVGRAELVRAPVGALEAQRPGLLAAAAPGRPEPAGEPAEIEHLHANRRRPEIAVVLAEQQDMKPSRAVAGARRDDDRVRRVGG